MQQVFAAFNSHHRINPQPLFYYRMNPKPLPLTITNPFLSIWSKMLSHEIIGYYAWFWGDFFFKIDKTLKFDGIFDVFPHPMYKPAFIQYKIVTL